MNISNLEKYVATKNKWQAIFNRKEFSLLNSQDRQSIAQMINGDLSPENLTCDGEANPAFVRTQHQFLSRCAQELMSIDPSVSFYEFS